MTHSALLVIDVQHSFEQKDFWQEDDLPEFQQALTRLIAGCQQRDVAIVDVFHVAAEGPFSLASGYVKRLPFLQHEADLSVQKRVHNALTDSGLEQWLRERDITHLIISGMRTEQCCETTTRVASDLGYDVTFVTEATLTFPMTHPDGQTLSADQIKHRTELVLVNRFADITDVKGALAKLDALKESAGHSVEHKEAWQPQPYLPRAISPLAPLTLNQWQLKRYAIRYAGATGSADIFQQGYPLVAQWLPQQAETLYRPGIGWLIEHQGKTMDYLVAGWWNNENELRIKVWVTECGEWRAAREESFCVWDMQVMAFERNAFVATLLQDKPDIPAYMAQHLRIDVE
ncbi:isochorismatase family protein [Edaphovirga cremea]|uniref:isochorismatase family protein n=1 Tax=Edaphovirga cremea TaxID=2267246 RepID=UPI000DF0012D|nr:isochorismatase family protein [Edaphovirga cremea]